MDAEVPGTVADEDGIAVAFAANADGVNYSADGRDRAPSASVGSAGRMRLRRADVPGGGDLAAILRYAV